MEIRENIENGPSWDENQKHPYQMSVIKDLQPNLKFRFFISSSGQKYLFYITRLGPIKIANLRFPNLEKESILEFIEFCKKNHYVYYISTFERLDYLSSFINGFTNVLDLNNIKLKKSIRCNIKKAIKENVKIRKLDESKFWEIQNEIHNSLMTRKGISFDSEYRKNMYGSLCRYNNKSTILYGAFHNDKMISGVVILYTKDFGLYLKTATLKEYYSYSPGPLIIQKICEQEKGRFAQLDMNLGVDAIFKSSKEEISKIIHFKKQFGEERKVYIYAPKWFINLKNIKTKVNNKNG